MAYLSGEVIEIEFTSKWTNEDVLALVGNYFNSDGDMNKGDMEV